MYIITRCFRVIDDKSQEAYKTIKPCSLVGLKHDKMVRSILYQLYGWLVAFVCVILSEIGVVILSNKRKKCLVGNGGKSFETRNSNKPQMAEQMLFPKACKNKFY